MKKFRDRKGNYHIKPENREVLKRISVYGIVKNSNNEILLVKPTWKDEYDLPGGGLEEGEGVSDALIREFFEETGYPIKILSKKSIMIKKALFYADDLDKYYNSELLFFMVSLLGNRKPELVNSSEIVKQIWCNIDDLKKMKINDIHLEVLKSIKWSDKND